MKGKGKTIVKTCENKFDESTNFDVQIHSYDVDTSDSHHNKLIDQHTIDVECLSSRDIDLIYKGLDSNRNNRYIEFEVFLKTSGYTTN